MNFNKGPFAACLLLHLRDFIENRRVYVAIECSCVEKEQTAVF
jgi:hypothetical protein